MPDFTAKDVQSLRQATGAGMMDAKKALQETNGDFDAAAKWLREKGLAQAAKRSDRENVQGAVAVSQADGAAAVVELKCETDFVAKSEEFVNLVNELATLVASKGEDAANDRAAEIETLKTTLKENIELGRVIRFEAPEGGIVDTYLHVQNDRGVIGVLVEMVGGSVEVAHDVALHIASASPRYLKREDVPEAEVAAEREVLENLTRNEGKPEQAIPKIVEGRLGGFFKDVTLLEQAFVKEPKRSIADVIGSATITRFARVQIGQ